MSNEIDAELTALVSVELVAAMSRYGDSQRRSSWSDITHSKDALLTIIGALVKERNSALAFSGSILKSARDYIGTDVSGGDVQDWAARDGLLEKVVVTESCGEECVCAEVGLPADCYRFTALGNLALEAAKRSGDE